MAVLFWKARNSINHPPIPVEFADKPRLDAYHLVVLLIAKILQHLGGTQTPEAETQIKTRPAEHFHHHRQKNAT